jgi:predicted PurR-regulated permease PerM
MNLPNHPFFMSTNNVSLGTTLQYLLLGCVLIFFLYFGQTLFVPLFYGLFIAIVLYPICGWLQAHGIPKAMAIGISLCIVLLLFVLLLWLLVMQFNAFAKDWPAINEKLQPTLNSLQQTISDKFNVSMTSQNEWWQNVATKLSSDSGSVLLSIVNKTAAGLFSFLLAPVFAALFLYNSQDFVLFLQKLLGNRSPQKLQVILHDTITTYFHFIKGMFFVYIIVGILNSAGLMALGIKHAILFGFLTAIMTIIPYIGIFISALLPITMAWLTKDSIWYPIGVILVFTVVQYLEANVIFPRVVAMQLNVSTFVTLAATIAGGILWGVSGMILFIPLTGILKMISDYIPEWEALNVLLKRNDSAKNKKIPVKQA